MKLVIIYLILNLWMTVMFIKDDLNWNSYMSSVPTGDLEFYERKDATLEHILFPIGYGLYKIIAIVYNIIVR